MGDGILGIKEVADYLNIKEQTVYRLVQTGKIPAVKFGGSWKVKRNHLDRMFDQILEEKMKKLT
tara:strand:- start:673 stop:864 length:192 start_codon:yes stop_codon:yes gene_type:complete